MNSWFYWSIGSKLDVHVQLTDFSDWMSNEHEIHFLKKVLHSVIGLYQVDLGFNAKVSEASLSYPK